MWQDRAKVATIVVVVLAIAYLLVKDFGLPEFLKNGHLGGSRAEDTPELRAADLHGRLRKAESYALEVQSRLTAYKARFDCDEAALLDRVFLAPDGALAIHPLRKEWYNLRSELPELVEKHRVYLTMLREAKADMSPGKVTDNFTLPERAIAWSESLDDSITQRTQSLPMFTAVARELKATMKAEPGSQWRGR